MRILLAGLPGSGKTTQAIKLAQELNVPLIRTGDILREMSTKEDGLGRRIKDIMDKGALVEDDLVAEIVEKKLAEMGKETGFIMDGYPRTVEQINRFDPEFDVVFYLQISEQEIRNRLFKRGRFDDTPEIVNHRLKAQEENMFDVLGYYKKNAQVHLINAERTIEEIHVEIYKFLQ